MGPSWYSALQTSPPTAATEKWWETGLRDLGRTMKDDTWTENRNCADEDWHCIAATSVAIKHNNMLGTMADKQNELRMYSPVYSDTYLHNLEATIVATNNSEMIDSYIEVRESVSREHSMFLKKTTVRPYVDEHQSYAGIAVILDLAREQSIPSVDYEALQYVHDNWVEEDAVKMYKLKLEEQISSEEFPEFDSNSKLSIHSQLAILTGSDVAIMNGYCSTQGETGGRDNHCGDPPGTLEDVGSILLGTGTLSLKLIKSGIKSLKSKKVDDGGFHPGFTSGFDCPTDEFNECITAQLENVKYFADARTTSAANANTCGEDPDLVTLSTGIGKMDYKVGDPVQYQLEADCTLNEYEYKIKTEIVDAAGQSVYSEKIEPWIETDNQELFNVDTITGFDEGTYCINSMLYEKFNPTPVAASTGTDCFDVDPVKSGTNTGDGGDDDDDDEGGLPIPGFTGMTAFIAMLGAAIIAFRRLEDQ